MNKRKCRYILPAIYLTFTFTCGILGLILKDDRWLIFSIWYFSSTLIWLFLLLRVINLTNLLRKLKHK